MKQPTPDQIRSKREAHKLSATNAASLVHVAVRTWYQWESGDRHMPLAAWELFNIKLQHKPLDELQAMIPKVHHENAKR